MQIKRRKSARARKEEKGWTPAKKKTEVLHIHLWTIEIGEVCTCELIVKMMRRVKKGEDWCIIMEEMCVYKLNRICN